MATNKKHGKAESNNDYNKIRRGHTDHQIVPQNLKQSYKNSCFVWKFSMEQKLHIHTHHKIPHDLGLISVGKNLPVKSNKMKDIIL